MVKRDYFKTKENLLDIRVDFIDGRNRIFDPYSILSDTPIHIQSSKIKSSSRLLTMTMMFRGTIKLFLTPEVSILLV